MISRACVDNVGGKSPERQVDLFSVVLVRSTHVLHSLLPWQSTVMPDFWAKNNLFELK